MGGQRVRIERKGSKKEMRIESKISSIGIDDPFEVNGIHFRALKILRSSGRARFRLFVGMI